MYRVNIPYILIAIIHFLLVYTKTPYQTSFSAEQTITWIILKVFSLLFIILFWQFIPYTIVQIKNRNIIFKEILSFSFIYLIINIFVLILIWPGHTHNEFLIIYSAQTKQEIIFFWHWLSSFEIAITYNILPYIWGVTLINSIIQSIIVGFCVHSIKNKISKNFYWITFLPFCFPCILILNHTPIRLILITWLTVLFYTLMFINMNKEINRKNFSILFGLLTGIIVAFRIEYTPLLILFPLAIYFLKVFNRKSFASFVLTLIITFSSITFIQKINIKEEYELHNLCFVYEYVLKNNLKDDNFENDKKIIEQVFPHLDEEAHSTDVNLSNKENIKKAYLILTRMLLKNSKHFINKNFNLFTKEQIQITNELFYKPCLGQDFAEQVLKEISPINSKLRDKIIKSFIYGTEKYDLSKIYNLYINLFILGFIFIYGLIKRNSFYTFFTICWLTIVSLILLTMPWENYMYLWAFFLNTWLFFTYAIAEILQNILNSIKEKMNN